MVCKPEHSSHRACSQHKQPATISELICSRKPRVNSVQELGGSFKCITSPVSPRPAAIPSGSWYFMNSSKPWDESHNFGRLIHRAFRQPSSRLLSSLLHRAGRTAHPVKFSERGNWLPDACCHFSSMIIRFNHVSMKCYAKRALCLSLVYRLLLCKDTVTIICVLDKSMFYSLRSIIIVCERQQLLWIGGSRTLIYLCIVLLVYMWWSVLCWQKKTY
jgi:hypothetical protein